MSATPIFASPSNARIFIAGIDPDTLRWLHEHNFLLDVKGKCHLRDFMSTAPYTHPISWEHDQESLEMWNFLFKHIFKYNTDVHSIRLHFLDNTTNRIFQIVKYYNDDLPSIIYTDPAPEPYFSSIILYEQNETISHFNRHLYTEHWRKAPDYVLACFKS